MYTVAKKFHFCAAHHHTKLPPGHPCLRPHGHNWEVTVGFDYENLDEHDFVIDYGVIRDVCKPIIDSLDHQDLNEILSINPTCENLAKHFFEVFKPLFESACNMEPSFVIVSEAEGTYAAYRPGKEWG